MPQLRSHISSKQRFSWPWLLGSRISSFTAEEVRKRLLFSGLEDAEDERTAAVHLAAAQTSVWSSHLRQQVAFDLGRSADRLPTVVFWYRQGTPLGEIGRRLSPFGGAWDAERAVDAAAELIATSLNRGEVSVATA